MNSGNPKGGSGGPRPKGTLQDVRIDGLQAAADMLKLLDPEHRERLLASVAKQDPKVRERLQERMFSFEDLLKIEEPALQRLLQEVPRPRLALALRTSSDELRRRISRNLPTRARAEIEEEARAQGPTPLSKVRAAQAEIIELGRKLGLVPR